MKEQFKLLHDWEDHIGPGHWPDADMIPIGLLNRRGPGHGTERRSNFTNVEKYTLMSLWAIGRSPMMYGGDLMMMRPVELRLLTNEEVLEVNQNSTNNRQLFRKNDHIAWVADVPGSTYKYLAVFNIGDIPDSKILVNLEGLGFEGKLPSGIYGIEKIWVLFLRNLNRWLKRMDPVFI